MSAQLKLSIEYLVVCGYVRRIEQSLVEGTSVTNNLFENIPSTIILVVVQFYLQHFFKIAGQGCIISKDKRSITKHENNGWSNASYSSPVSSTTPTIHRWDLLIHEKDRYHRLKKEGSGDYISIGISSGDTTTMQFVHGKGYKYGYCGLTGNKLNCIGANNNWLDEYGETYGEGDVISVKLDLIHQSIIFYKNYQSQGIAYNGYEIRKGSDTFKLHRINIHKHPSKFS